MTVVPVDFRPRIVIETKGKTYVLDPGAVGVPMEEILGDHCPPSLRGAKRYATEDGLIVVRPDHAK